MQTTTYRAVLKGNHLEWPEEPPPEVAGERPVFVHVTILHDERPAPSRATIQAPRRLVSTVSVAVRTGKSVSPMMATISLWRLSPGARIASACAL